MGHQWPTVYLLALQATATLTYICGSLPLLYTYTQPGMSIMWVATQTHGHANIVLLIYRSYFEKDRLEKVFLFAFITTLLKNFWIKNYGTGITLVPWHNILPNCMDASSSIIGKSLIDTQSVSQSINQSIHKNSVTDEDLLTFLACVMPSFQRASRTLLAVNSSLSHCISEPLTPPGAGSPAADSCDIVRLEFGDPR